MGNRSPIAGFPLVHEAAACHERHKRTRFFLITLWFVSEEHLAGVFPCIGMPMGHFISCCI